jgi:PhoH-like ATPase
VDYEKQKVDIATLYQGLREIDISPESLARIEGTGELPWKEKLLPNEFALLRERTSGRELLARQEGEDLALKALPAWEGSVVGISPMNPRQRVALELLRRVLEDKTYMRMLVTRPVVPVGKDIGYLPGEKNAKMSAWMQPLFDNLEQILGVYKRPNLKGIDQLVKDKVLEIEALSFIRGRSLPRQYMIVDEAQNLTPHEIKTLVSRAGEGTKVVLTGDPYQIDNMYLDANSNGLSYLVEAFKGQPIYGHITLQKSERSGLAELAASLL